MLKIFQTESDFHFVNELNESIYNHKQTKGASTTDTENVIDVALS